MVIILIILFAVVYSLTSSKSFSDYRQDNKEGKHPLLAGEFAVPVGQETCECPIVEPTYNECQGVTDKVTCVGDIEKEIPPSRCTKLHIGTVEPGEGHLEVADCTWGEMKKCTCDRNSINAYFRETFDPDGDGVCDHPTNYLPNQACELPSDWVGKCQKPTSQSCSQYKCKVKGPSPGAGWHITGVTCGETEK